MKKQFNSVAALGIAAVTFALAAATVQGGAPAVSGELKQWHAVTLTLDGPMAHESDSVPNPFMNYRMNVTFTHASGSPSYRVPGYFAADGDAANSSASSTAFVMDSTVLSISTTTPLRRPREGLDPTPIILRPPASATSATIAQIFVVPMSSPTRM